MASSDSEQTEPSGRCELPLEVYNDLLCPICLEFFKHPVILPCSHVLCRAPCADQLFDFNFIRCPVCRENCYISGGLASLPRVIALESIIEKYRADRRKAHQHQHQSSGGHRHVGGGKPGQHQKGCGYGKHVGGQVALDTSSSSVNSSPTPAVAAGVGIRACVSPENHPHLEQRSRRKGRTASCRLSADGTFSTLRYEDAPLPTPGSSAAAFIRSPRSHRPITLSITSTPRSLDSLDVSLLDVTTDSVASCPRHGSETSLYCHACERCVCNVCGDVNHVTSHETNNLTDAALQIKCSLSQSLDKMAAGQIKVEAALQQQRQHIKDVEEAFSRKDEDINMQCDSLLAEVEHKRSLFLAELEQEEHVRKRETDDVIDILEKVLGTSQSLVHYTTELMDKDDATVLQMASAVNEQLHGSILDCDSCQIQADNRLAGDLTPGRVVDLRKEQSLLRDIHYLNPPAPPTIDVTRCARGENTVALFLLPTHTSDVIDSYVIRYCSEEQRSLGIEETVRYDGGHSDLSGSGPCSPLLVVLLEDLTPATPYLFCAATANRAGCSDNSDVVQCLTLSPMESVVPVPVIQEVMCKTYTSSIRVFTPSPLDVAVEQSVSHLLLYRRRERRSLWRSVALCGRPEHRVFGLEPQTQYEFVVMATNPRGECQVSQKLVLETERSSV